MLCTLLAKICGDYSFFPRLIDLAQCKYKTIICYLFLPKRKKVKKCFKFTFSHDIAIFEYFFVNYHQIGES